MPETITEYADFFTATNLEWKKLLSRDKYKDIIIDSLRFLVTNRRVIVYGFVIMENHIHIIWQLHANRKRQDVQRDFLKFTAQQIKKDMIKNYPKEVASYEVNSKDRRYQFWERNPLSTEIWSERVLLQKLKYIHENPVRAGICQFPDDYKYSSASFYKYGIDNWGFLTHLRD